MRGISLLQDGAPINLADDNGDFQELDPLVFEHIEVYRGANSLRFGGTTLGGGINGVTPTGRSAPGLDLRLDGGSFDTIRGKAAFGYADARGDAWAALTFDRSDGERDHHEETERTHLALPSAVSSARILRCRERQTRCTLPWHTGSPSAPTSEIVLPGGSGTSLFPVHDPR